MRNTDRGILGLLSGALVAGQAQPAAADSLERVDFESTALGALPTGMTTALTGGGGAVKWSVVDVSTAPAGSKVMAQTSTDRIDHRFPLAIFDAPVVGDATVTVSFKAMAGEIDRAAGIALRLHDANNFNGKSLFSATDSTFTAAGRVALWTKADSVSRFDDVTILSP